MINTITLTPDLPQDTIIIDGGEIFEGTWSHLQDCFGLNSEEDLKGFCEFNDFKYEIKRPVLH